MIIIASIKQSTTIGLTPLKRGILIINLGNSYEGESTVGAQVAFAGLVGAACIDLWSVGDAVRVAKVNNLALMVKHKTSYNLNIKPFLNTPDYGRKHNIPIGLALKGTF